MTCCVPYCGIRSSEKQNVTLFKFPITQWLKSSWLVAIGMNASQLPLGAVVCSQHFHTDDLFITNYGLMKLRNNVVPSIFRDNGADNVQQFCMICLDTASKMYSVGKYLSKAYTFVTGLDYGELKSHVCHRLSQPKLCTECAQRLINCVKFKERGLKTYQLIMKLHNKRRMLSLETIEKINRVEYKLKSNLAKHIIKPNHCDLYVTEDLVDNDVKEENSDNTAEPTEGSTDKSGVDLEDDNLDFDIDDETEYFCDNDDMVRDISENGKNNELIRNDSEQINDDVTSFKVINIDSDDEDEPRNDKNNDEPMNDDRYTDIDYLNDDTDDEDEEYLDDFDSYLKFLNNNIVTKNDIDNGRLTEIITNTAQNKEDASKKKIVSLKNILLVKDFKPEVEKPVKRKRKVERICTNVRQYKERVSKPKLQGSDLKLFNGIELSYAEQLAEIQKRRDSVSYTKFPFRCTLCYKGHWHSVPYSRHMEKHTNAYGLLVCAVCKMHLRTRSKLAAHIKSNHQYRYNCRSCPYVTSSIWAAKGHEQWHGGKMYKCQHCGIEIAKRTSYLTHLRIKHPSSSHVCALCGYSFVSAMGLKFHMKRKHRFETQKLDGPTCVECGIRFASDTAYDLHMKVSPKHSAAGKPKRNEPYLSTKRRPRIPRLRVRKTRVRIKEQQPVLCELCGKCFKFPELLRRHIRIHTGEKPFECGKCDKRFLHKLSLTLHSQTHSGRPQRFVCEVCGKCFSSTSSRHRHLASHRDARKYYKCDVCEKQFTTAEGRDKHVLHVHRKVPWPKRVRTRPSIRASGSLQVDHARDTSVAKEMQEQGIPQVTSVYM